MRRVPDIEVEGAFTFWIFKMEIKGKRKQHGAVESP